MKDINYFWRDHPIVQRLVGFKPGTNERIKEAEEILEEEQETNPLTFNCMCKKCGEKLRCEHKEEEPHEMSVCAFCGGELL